MARLPRGATSGELRAYLITEAEHFVTVYGRMDPALHAVYSAAVDALRAGEAVQLHRYELPDGHPDGSAGDMHDYLELGADDVLVELR